MRYLLKYLKNYTKECVLAPLFKMLEASFELFVPLVVASMIDKGMAMGDRSYIIRSCILLVVLAVVGLISAVTAQFFSAKAAVGFAASVRKDLFSHLMTLSYNEYDELGTSTMITRMTSDVAQTQTGVNLFLRLTLRSPFVVLGAMVMAFTVDSKAAMIFVIVILILTTVVAVIMYYNIPLLEKAQKRLDKVMLLTRENLIGIRVLRAFARKNHEIKSYEEANNSLYNSQMIAARVSSALNPATYVIINMAIVCLIYVGAIRVDGGYLTQGSVVALYNCMSQILVELIKLANMIVTLNKAIASGNRIAGVLQMENSQQSIKVDLQREEKPSQYISFKEVCFKYNNEGEDVLENIDFTVNKGEIVGVIGGTGAGKSSLVNLVAGFYLPTSGNVYINGQNTKNISEADVRSKIGFVFQKTSLFTGTIADNLKYGKKDASQEEMLCAMELAVATDVINQKGGLDAQIGESGKELSGGQRQRITIARALIKQPDILILDDSTSALDFATQAKLIDNIRKLDYKPTVFLVSQRANVMLGADKIIVLDDGEVKGIGTHEKLVDSCDTYREIYNTQFDIEDAQKGGNDYEK